MELNIFLQKTCGGYPYTDSQLVPPYLCDVIQHCMIIFGVMGLYRNDVLALRQNIHSLPVVSVLPGIGYDIWHGAVYEQ